MPSWLQKLVLISLPAFFFACAFIEAGLRLFVAVSEPVESFYDAENALLVFEPGQSGIRVRPDFTAHYRINSVGWNSARNYTVDKLPGELRIAVIGDSYVEAFQVDYDKNFGVILEHTLGEYVSTPVMVYSFGRSGAPLSQYLHIMRYVSAAYAPDIYVILIIDNDFEQSFAHMSPSPHFLQFELGEHNEIIEIEPVPWEPTTKGRVFRILTFSALFRYVWCNLQLGDTVTNAVEDNPVMAEPVYDQGIDTELIDSLLVYTFQEYRDIVRQTGSRLLLVMDGPRRGIYEGKLPDDIPEYAYTILSAGVAEEYGIPFLDLTAAFQADYQQHGRRFNFPGDYHWNAYGHRLVGETISEELIRLNWVGSAAPAE
ncbi:MAG: SGNH/GDSL hydrolase family protein [Anaerolineae bacterium]|nr:SGNH/GDSL hydrolase family protein [Anaerolineae bacterium]